MSEEPDSTTIDSSHPIETIRRFYRDAPKSSEWFVVTQELVDQFGRSTFDTEWIHSDPERAGRESPYRNTIAHGFWTLAMLTHLSQQATGTAYPPGARFGINYGLNRVRFPSAVPVGSRIRLRYHLIDIESRSDGQYLVRTENVIDVEGQEKPALVADWLFLLVYPA
jgi:acyl dehydratase